MDDEVDSSGTQHPADTSTSPNGHRGQSPRHPQQPLLPSKLPEHPYTVHQIGGAYPDIILRAYHDIGHKDKDEDEGKDRGKGTDLGPSPYLASSLVAGFLSSINAAHIAAGKDSLGWLNSLLHSSSISLSDNDDSSEEGVNEEKLLPVGGRSKRSPELGSVTFQTLRNILTLKDVDYTDSQQNTDDDEKQMLHRGNKGKRNGSRRSNHSSSFPSLSLTFSPLQALSHSPYLKRGEGQNTAVSIMYDSYFN